MRNTRTFVLLLSLLLFAGCSHKATVYIESTNDAEIDSFAKEELSLFLGKNYTLTNDREATWKILLTDDPNLKEGSFGVEYQEEKENHVICLKGRTSPDILCAMYTFLEKAGMRFEITGPLFAERVDLNRLKNVSEEITPKTLHRGIRQHINFPMDVSSYSLDEAKEYIRNLARLRFNYITFHSYSGQWYADPSNETESYAGNFFYGTTHKIPAVPLLQEKIRNKKYYCIPEIEPFYEDKNVRSEMAIDWLHQVMTECKRAGLSIGLSFEPERRDTAVDRTLIIVRNLLKIYPQINDLEFITTETAEPTTPCSDQEVTKYLTPFFGKEVLNDYVVMKPIKEYNSGIAELFAQIGHNIKALDAARPLLDAAGVNGRLGLYVASPLYQESTFHLLRKYAPNENYAVMPGHGSMRVARYLPLTAIDTTGYAQTAVYSWLEFDGIMYLQQNGIRGIRSLLEEMTDAMEFKPLQNVCFNHWRTAENRITARYASEATLFGPQDETPFYESYARAYGLTHPELFSEAMKTLDAATWYATNDLPNVGFCYALGAYTSGLGFLGAMKPENLKTGIQLYSETLNKIDECIVPGISKETSDLLLLLKNRLEATIIYLETFKEGTEIQKFNPETLNADQRAEIASIIDRAIEGFEKYLNHYAMIMPDRGSEGNIISAYYVRIGTLKKIRKALCGKEENKPTGSDQSTQKAPPAPIQQ